MNEGEIVEFDSEAAWIRTAEAWKAKYPAQAPTQFGRDYDSFKQWIKSEAEVEILMGLIAEHRGGNRVLRRVVEQVKTRTQVRAAQITKVDLNTKRDLSGEEAAMEEIATMWPQNLEAPETVSSRMDVLRSVFSRYDYRDVRRAARLYVDRFQCRQAGPFPYLLRNFMLRNDGELLATWTFRSQFQPTEQDKKRFDAAWDWYPEFEGREADSLEGLHVYLQWIPVEKQLDFQYAVMAYEQDRNGDDPRFTKKFSKFVMYWDVDDDGPRHKRCRLAADKLAWWVRDWAQTNKVYWDGFENTYGGIWGFMFHQKMTCRQAVEQFWRDWMKRNPVVEQEVIDGIFEAAWEEAAKRRPREKLAVAEPDEPFDEEAETT